MNDELYFTPEQDRRMQDLLNSSHFIEGDGQMHPVSYDGDADEDDEGAPGAEVHERAGETTVADPRDLTSETAEPILSGLAEAMKVLEALDFRDPVYLQTSAEASRLFLRLADGLRNSTDPRLVKMQVDAEIAHHGIESFLAINWEGLIECR